MEKTDKAAESSQPETVKTEGAKTEIARPAPKQPRWPGQGNSGGIKNAKVGHDRKTSGRGAARGR